VLEDLVKFTNAVNDNDYDDQYCIVTMTPVLVDLDVDSDNTGTLDRTPHEDDIEEATDEHSVIVRPGLIVPVGPERTKMIAEVPAGMTATLEFDAAAAKKVKVFTLSGAVALDTATLKTTVVGGEPQTFWIEAFAPSASMADIAFTLTLVVGTGSCSAGSPRRQAESSSSSYELVVHLLMLSTSPHGDAVSFGYEAQVRPRRGLAPRWFGTLAIARAAVFDRRAAPHAARPAAAACIAASPCLEARGASRGNPRRLS
jgi:hypothetical protein